jgi:DNA modification methylase
MSFQVIHGDMRLVLREMEPESVDAVVCDPPYELGFMGKSWDKAGVAFDPATWAECLRVLKPGAHLIAFGAPRTFHRITCAIEDAGFEIRDCLSWLFGSGFPKSLDVSKAIDKAAGAEREPDEYTGANHRNKVYGRGMGGGQTLRRGDPATAAAAALQGWGTALKPAWEPIILARKPLGGTVAANILEHGTGALNVDGCRIETADTWDGGGPTKPRDGGIGFASSSSSSSHPLGRWPANVAFDEDAAAQLDEQSGGVGQRGDLTGDEPSSKTSGVFGKYAGRGPATARGDIGGASRFFYTAKASASERSGASGTRNPHPTVKPLALMRWLVRLVTPPGGLIVDPFCGSGTTGQAALLEGFRVVLIEQDEEMAAFARKRIAGPLFSQEVDVPPVEPAAQPAVQEQNAGNGGANG